MGGINLKDKRIFALLLAVVVILFGVFAISSNSKTKVKMASSIEDRYSDGRAYNPSTQSLLRGHHWLESVENVVIDPGGTNTVDFHFKSSDSTHSLEVGDFPIDLVVPRLHYAPASPPDRFDGFNLMMAEYSRSGVAIPVGNPGDKTVHFRTTLKSEVPYEMKGDYEFVPNPHFRPMRINMINNCLAPGLWEMNATDRTGEIFHGWFEMPLDYYVEKVAETNGLKKEFVAKSLTWSTDRVPINLERLRKVQEKAFSTTAGILQSEDSPGYSSQDSRRKLAKGYALVDTGGELQIPENIAQITSHPLHLSEFVVPGKYSIDQRRKFDLGFLRNIRGATIQTVTPLTDYDWTGSHRKTPKPAHDATYFEITLDLGDYAMIIGNLPSNLLVPQEDYSIEGFGVGVLKSGEVIERRQLLVERGHSPSFAYLTQDVEGAPHAVNSHDFGIEQIFIRTHSLDPEPWWEITLTSYERIVDIIKFKVDLPKELAPQLVEEANSYIPPLYRTYRDDNLR